MKKVRWGYINRGAEWLSGECEGTMRSERQGSGAGLGQSLVRIRAQGSKEFLEPGSVTFRFAF